MLVKSVRQVAADFVKALNVSDQVFEFVERNEWEQDCLGLSIPD